MFAYLTRASCEKLRRLCVFFAVAIAFSARSLAAQDFSNLSSEESKQKRGEFVSAALAYRGTPYLYGGTTSRGMDCSGLIYRAGIEALGIELPRSSSGLSQHAQKIEDSEIEPGDLVFFNTAGEGISHAGIYIGDGEFVHSASSGPQTGVVVSKLAEPYWKRAYRFAGRIFPTVAATEPGASANYPSSGSGAGFPSSASARAQPSPDGLRVELRAAALWDFNIEEYIIRGTTVSATGQWRGRSSFYPGVTAGFTWDTRHDTMAVPLYFSVTMQNGLSLFAGAQLIFYSGGEGSTEFFFPGLVGVSWTSPYKDLGLVKIGFYQSIECVFVRKEGVAGRFLSDTFRLSTGASFAIGK